MDRVPRLRAWKAAYRWRAQPGVSSVPLRPMNSVRSAGPRNLPPGKIRKRYAAAELDTPGVPREHRASFRIDLGDHERSRCAAGSTEYPLHVCSDRQTPGPSGEIANFQSRNLDRIIQGNKLLEQQRDRMRTIFETAITLAMPDYVRGRLLANRQGGGTPNLSAVLIAKVDTSPGRSLTGSFDHCVIWFSRLFIDQV